MTRPTPVADNTIVREKEEAGRAEEKLKLWFFRDMSDEQRLKLFSLFGLPTDEIGKTHGHQSHALKHVLAALASQPLPVAVKGLDDYERMLLGWMLAAFEQSKVGQTITDDLKREMRAANRLVARLSALAPVQAVPDMVLVEAAREVIQQKFSTYTPTAR